MLDASVTTLAAVRGQCLGGGLELAGVLPPRRSPSPGREARASPRSCSACSRRSPPSILPERIGRPAAEDLCLSGRIVDADEALPGASSTQIADDPAEAALACIREHLLPRSASSLRLAVRAARAGWADRFRTSLAEVERLYLDELMATDDAVEGLQAFLEKRKPVWRNR